MDLSPEDIARFRALFALRRFSATVQSDVLSGSDIASHFRIIASPIARLNDELSVDRTQLFTAFQCAVDGLPVPPLLDQAGTTVDLSVTVDGDVAVVAHQNKRWLFKHVPLLSADPSRRLAALADYMSKYTLASVDRARLEALVNRPAYSHHDFIETVTLLSSSPEAFASALRQKANAGELAMRDLLPQHLSYWSHLVAPPLPSRSLQDFISGELAADRQARIRDNPVNALVTISMTFASPALVPRELFADVSSEALLDGIDRLSQFDDPFALSGTFDICVDRAVTDPRFVLAGAKILEKLFGDINHLNAVCDMFGAAFVIAVAYLAEHETLRRHPIYWRRLAAASHAALIVRALGIPKETARESLLPWATGLRGSTYYLSVLNELYDEPRWRPDWIAPRFVIADVHGRVRVSAHRYSPLELPPGWQQPLATAQSWLNSNQYQLLAYYPALLEGARRDKRPSLEELVAITDAYQRLIDKPSLDTFLALTPPVQTFGFPREGIDAAMQVIQSLRTEAKENAQVVQAALTLAAGIAVEHLDTQVADLVANVALEMAAGTPMLDSATEIVFRIVECAAANRDRAEARAVLSRRLENLAFVVPPPALNNLIVLLNILQTLDEHLATELGRAIAIARLGKSRVAAA